MNICLCLESKEDLICHILKWLNALYAVKRHTEGMKLKKNLDLDMMVRYHNHGAEHVGV